MVSKGGRGKSSHQLTRIKNGAVTGSRAGLLAINRRKFEPRNDPSYIEGGPKQDDPIT